MSPRNLALVADPNGESARLLVSLLRALGLETVIAQDGTEVLRLLEMESPDIVIAERDLASMDGLTLSITLRENKETQTIPIVLLGAGDDRQGRLAALRAGADEFFSRPLDPEEIRLRLTALLRRTALASRNGKMSAPVSAPDSPSAPEERYRGWITAVETVCNQVRTGAPRLDRVRQAAIELVGETAQSSEYLRLALGPRRALDWASHQINVSVLALTLARELRYPEDKLDRLALFALVHDLGMVKLPPEILEAPRRLSKRELALVHEHPRYTHQILLSAGAEDIAELALQEHEREDGQGYPRGLRGSEIDELVKILGVADVFEACTHSRPYAKTFIPYDALQELIEMRNRQFNARYIKALMNALTVYPLGSYVLLNNGEIGRVSATHRKNLMRPVVDILWNAKGHSLAEPRSLDLSQHPFLFINKALAEEQIPPSETVEEATSSP